MGGVNTVPSLPPSLFLLPICTSPLCFLVSEKQGLVNQSVSHSFISFVAKRQQHAYVYMSAHAHMCPQNSIRRTSKPKAEWETKLVKHKRNGNERTVIRTDQP